MGEEARPDGRAGRGARHGGDMTDGTPRLTPAEQRILDEVRRDKVRRYNGRAFRQVERLQALGLVDADFEISPRAGKGSHAWLITVRPRG